MVDTTTRPCLTWKRPSKSFKGVSSWIRSWRTAETAGKTSRWSRSMWASDQADKEEREWNSSEESWGTAQAMPGPGYRQGTLAAK